MPKISFVVSTCDRPAMLPIVLHSLAVQTMPDFEVIITDNSLGVNQIANFGTIANLQDRRFLHIDTSMRKPGGCYLAANVAVEEWCEGDFLCFPSDDSYYVPVFAERMLDAAESYAWDLVYCNMVYDSRFNGSHYATVNVHPMINSIDKTGFIVKRSKFEPFHNTRKADGELIESLVENGIRHGKIQDVLMVHN